jgi:hypothetical protein
MPDMGGTMQEPWMPLSDAALALKRSYDQVMRLMHVGALEGRRSPTGRWLVSRASVAAYLEHELATQVVA